MFVDWYKPGYKGGGPVRSMINLVDHLGERIHFHFVTSDTDYTATEPYPGITPDRWTALPSGEQVWYASRAQADARAWERLITERNWDAIYVNGLFSFRYSILPLWCSQRVKARRIVAPRGMLLPGPMGQGSLKKQVFLALARGLGLYRGVEFHSTSAEETKSIQALVHRKAVVHEVPNLARKRSASARIQRPKVPGEARLVNVVRIATEKNIHLIIASLRNVKGRVVFDLFGPVHHQAYWEQCRTAIASLPSNIGFTYHGPVPSEEVPAVLERPYHALFMPNEGDNFGHTMLEAMSAGLPLLISDRTPWRGLQQQHAGWDLPLNGAAVFTSALQELIDMDQHAFDRLSDGAFAIGHRFGSDRSPIDRTAALFGA